MKDMSPIAALNYERAQAKARRAIRRATAARLKMSLAPCWQNPVLNPDGVIAAWEEHIDGVHFVEYTQERRP